MAPAENLFGKLSTELRQYIIKLAGEFNGSWSTAQWSRLRMVDKQFSADCAVVRECSSLQRNEYAFLNKPLAMVGVESAAMLIDPDSFEPMTCLQKALGEAGPTLTSVLLIHWEQHLKPCFWSIERQAYMLRLLAGCPKLHALSLRISKKTVMDVPAGSLQAGVGFQRLQHLTIYNCSMRSFPFGSFPLLSQLSLKFVTLTEGRLSILGPKLTSFTLLCLHGSSVDIEAPSLEHLVVDACTSYLNFADTLRLKFLYFDEGIANFGTEYKCRFQRLPERLHEMAVKDTSLACVSNIVAKFGTIRLLTMDLGINSTKGIDIGRVSNALRNVMELRLTNVWKWDEAVIDLEPDPGFDKLTMLSLDFRTDRSPNIGVARGFLQRARKLTHIRALLHADTTHIFGYNELASFKVPVLLG